MSDTSRLCDCGHSQAVHVGLQRECQATVPTHCQCKAWMHAVENVGTHDPVAAPRHYLQHPAGIECIDVVEHMPFNLGNAIKYIWRSGKKGDAVEDLKKSVWYIQREIQRLDKGGK